MMEVENKREESSGSVFADLNIPKPSLYLAKAQLAHQICEIVRERNLSQVRNADALPVVEDDDLSDSSVLLRY